MDAQLKQVIDDAVSLSVIERTGIANEALGRIIAALKEADNSTETISEFIIAITKLFVSADKSCDQEEYELFCNATGIPFTADEFYALTDYGANEEFVSNLLRVIAPLTPDVRNAICVYGIMLLSSDRKVNSQEVKIMERVLAA